MKSNPFSLDKESELIGYDDVIDEIIYAIESGNMLFIEALDGHGKTSLLKFVINKYKGQGRVAYVDCNRLEHLNIENVIMKRYGLLRRLFSKTPREMIILIDNINNLSKKNCERLKYFFDQNYVISVVFAGTSYNSTYFTVSLKDRITKVMKLPELKDNDAIEIIEDRLNSSEIFVDGTIKEIFSISNKNPKLFIQNCEKALKYAAENYSRIVKQDHLTKIFNVKKEPLKQEVEEEYIHEHEHEHQAEELLQIKPKKESYKQKVERELIEEKDIKIKKILKTGKKSVKKLKKESVKKEIEKSLEEKSPENIAERYY